MDDRLRLKVNVPGNPIRKIYRGNTMDWANAGNDEEIVDYHILNEVVVDRGPCPTSVQLELYFDDTYITSLVGDGLIISTPTGSTAYNMSAGGSIVQVNTDCMCVTPLAPHSLSFRPLIISPATVIKIRKPVDNRNSAWVSLDGATRFELKDGEELIVQGSEKKLSLIVGKSDNLMNEWAHRIRTMLNWNQREQLKPLQKKDL